MFQFIKDTLARWWDQRFMHGPSFTLATTGVHKYPNGSWHFVLQVGALTSPGTGHWPFAVFETVLKTGERWCFHIKLLGLCVGTIWLPDLNEDGSLNGPDYCKLYFMFSCINHKAKQLEEII